MGRTATLVAFLLLAAAAACGGDSSEDGPGGGDGGGPDGGTTDGPEDGPLPPIPDGPDVPPIAFPTTVPLLFGYTLEDAFPKTFLSGAMDIAWPTGSNEPFVLQRGGHIVRLHGNGQRTLVLDFEGQVAMRGEAGALGMALHPKFGAGSPYVYLWYNAEGAPTRQRLVRYTYDAGQGRFDAGSALVMIEQAEGATEHNGARVRFGPDGFLYFGNGDDTRSADTTQRLDGGLFSGIFRIDVDQNPALSHAPPRQPSGAVTQGYGIPNDNPFVGVASANEEYFALGFRNPYSFNFDRAGGTLWVGDVGDSFREEIDRVEKGGNYGWPVFEGTRKVRDGAPTIGTLKTPVHEYTHASIGDLVATMNGYVYRGKALPELTGRLFFSDWPTGRVWALDTATGKRTSLLESNPDNAPVGWGQDADGEIYVVAWSKILKVVRAPAHNVPKKLSETKIFRNVQTLLTPSALVPYDIQSPLWSDGADKKRWVYVPAGAKATMKEDGTVTLPTGALLIKHFELGGRKLETRVLVTGEGTTYGMTYKWTADGREAELVTDAVEEKIPEGTWHYPSSGECWSCHRAENRILGFRGEQLNARGQLASFVAKGIIDAAETAKSPPPIAAPTDTSASLEARAMAVLQANCMPCHHPEASYLGGEETWNAMPNVPIAERGIVGKPHHNLPMALAFGIPTAPLVAPGDPKNSILLQRMKTTDRDLAMPPLLRTKVDPVGVAAVEAWIASLKP